MLNSLSLFFGQLFGVFYVILGLSFLLQQERSKKAIHDVVDSHGLMFVTGIITTLLGAVVVITHNTWAYTWEVVVTLIGWRFLLQGAARLLIPHHVARYFKAVLHGYYTLFSWFWFLVGAYLLWSVISIMRCACAA